MIGWMTAAALLRSWPGGYSPGQHSGAPSTGTRSPGMECAHRLLYFLFNLDRKAK